MAIIKSKNKKLSLNVQHDYITLRTPNGNYTSSFSGAKASGKLVSHDKAFEKIDVFVQKQSKLSTPLDAMKLLLNGKTLSKLWKEWDDAIKTNDFEVGDVVSFEEDNLFFKKYKGEYTVKSVARKNVFIGIENKHGKMETIGFDYQLLIKK